MRYVYESRLWRYSLSFIVKCAINNSSLYFLGKSDLKAIGIWNDNFVAVGGEQQSLNEGGTEKEEILRIFAFMFIPYKNTFLWIFKVFQHP